MSEQKSVATSFSARPKAADWRAAYAGRLAVTDVLVVIWVTFGTQFVWLGFDSTLSLSNASAFGRSPGISYSVISVIIVLAWAIALAGFGTRSNRVIGTGPEEYKQVFNASIALFGVVAIVAYLLKIDLARGYVLIAFPLGTIVLLAVRWLWRQWLAVQRVSGQFLSKVVIVGSAPSVDRLAHELHRRPGSGFQVVGACIPSGDRTRIIGYGVPVLGGLDAVAEALESSGADTVIITSSEELSAERVRNISWGLEPSRQHLIVAPSLVDIGGPRLHTRPVAGLPLIHVETPRYEGPKLFGKRAFDLIASSILIVLLSPVLAAVALAVKFSSPGPVLFSQERIGRDGSTFRMLKFRSMVVDAEARLADLLAQRRDAGNSVLFKLKDDPRITSVGKFLRRYSLDELPQLFNVLAGSMSLVGPRPPLEHEVAQYEQHIHRRFLVKPGVTGLWQVNGRSNLSWEESVRLDLYYVENWSIAGDVVILWRTAKAVFEKEGAY